MAITLNSNTFESLDFVLDDLQDLEKDTNTTNSSLLNSSLCDFSALCIPDDPIEDITWLLPNFTDNHPHHHYSKDENFSTSPNSLIDFPTTPEQETEFKGNKRGFGGLLDEVVQQQQEDGPVKKKQRSKRSGGRVWCLNANALLPKRRSCGHCGTVKTPQWREGPMGPKTLCNACGVRYKSGRLVPEYRPAASPTFDSQRHSNSHRKIVRMRMSRDTSM